MIVFLYFIGKNNWKKKSLPSYSVVFSYWWIWIFFLDLLWRIPLFPVCLNFAICGNSFRPTPQQRASVSIADFALMVLVDSFWILWSIFEYALLGFYAFDNFFLLLLTVSNSQYSPSTFSTSNHFLVEYLVRFLHWSTVQEFRKKA